MNQINQCFCEHFSQKTPRVNEWKMFVARFYILRMAPLSALVTSFEYRAR